MTVATFPAIAQTDSLFLTIDQLFERGVRHSLQIQADVLKESIAQERTHTARSAQLPDLQIGLKGGYVGQPILFEQGLAHPTRPEAPDWSQNYAIDLFSGDQPLNGGNAAERRRAVGDDEIVVIPVRGSLDAEDGIVEEIVGVGRAVRDVDHQGNRVGRTVGKAAGDVVGDVFELLHCGRDFLLCLLRNDALLIEHAGDRRRRNPR